MSRIHIAVVIVIVGIASSTYFYQSDPPPGFVANADDTNTATARFNSTHLSKYLASASSLPDTTDEIFTAIEQVQQSNAGRLPQSPKTFELIWYLFAQLTRPFTANSLLFELFRPTSTVYLADGARPETQWREIPLPQPVLEYASEYNVPKDVIWHNLDSIVQVDGLTLKDNKLQNVRYELQMNDDTFDSIVAAGMYNANGIAANSNGLVFPNGAVEMKTSWIWIEDKQQFDVLSPYYYIGYAYYATDNNTYEIGRAALSGIHYVPKAGGEWIWTTFENVHNPEFTKIKYSLPISETLAKINLDFQAVLRESGSVFANYRLNGVQTSYTSEDGSTPFLLANSQIESHFQQVSSCATCHSLAAYQANNVSPTLDFFNIVDTENNGTSYYTGTPPALSDNWSSMDFVWSLKRASWRR